MRHRMAAHAVLSSLAVFTACQAGPGKPADAEIQTLTSAPVSLEGTAYGQPLTLTELTPVSAILGDPEGYVGRKVLVQGLVVAVCENRGCWMDIASDREFEKIQIKVDDGVIVFPLTAKGKRAVVEGTVEELHLTAEEALEQARHQAEERGVAFDSSSVTGPQVIYRIRGIGAVVAD